MLCQQLTMMLGCMLPGASPGLGDESDDDSEEMAQAHCSRQQHSHPCTPLASWGMQAAAARTAPTACVLTDDSSPGMQQCPQVCAALPCQGGTGSPSLTSSGSITKEASMATEAVAAADADADANECTTAAACSSPFAAAASAAHQAAASWGASGPCSWQQLIRPGSDSSCSSDGNVVTDHAAAEFGFAFSDCEPYADILGSGSSSSSMDLEDTYLHSIQSTPHAAAGQAVQLKAPLAAAPTCSVPDGCEGAAALGLVRPQSSAGHRGADRCSTQELPAGRKLSGGKQTHLSVLTPACDTVGWPAHVLGVCSQALHLAFKQWHIAFPLAGLLVDAVPHQCPHMLAWYQ